MRGLRASKIREVANAGLARKDVLAFWFGEPDEVTPAFIRQAGIDALHAGETFYTHNLGIPELRDAIASLRLAPASTGRRRQHRGHEFGDVGADADDAGAGRAAATASSRSRRCGPTSWRFRRYWAPSRLRRSCSFGDGWTLDLDRLLHAASPGTRAVYINSPNNPTGWTLDAESQRAILAHCRRHGIWIVADDAYERLYYEGAEPERGAVVPRSRRSGRSGREHEHVLEILADDGMAAGLDRGARELIADLAKLIEYNTSCAPPFIQRAGVVAVTEGEA